MRIVRVAHSGNTYLYQTSLHLKAGEEVLVETKQGKKKAWGTVLSDSMYVPILARPVLAYVLSTYRKRPLDWAICTKEGMEVDGKEIEDVLGCVNDVMIDLDDDTDERVTVMDKSTAEE